MTSPPREKPEENAKRKKNHENNPCMIPTKDIEKKLNLISIRVRILESRWRVKIISIRGSLTISIKCVRHVMQSSRVDRVERISSVPISISLEGQTCLVFATPHLRSVRIFEFSGAAATVVGCGRQLSFSRAVRKA